MTTEAKILTLWNEQADSLISRRVELKRRDRQLYRLITRMKLRQQELEEHQQPLPDGEPGQMMLPGDIISLKLLEADHHDVDQIRADYDTLMQLENEYVRNLDGFMLRLRATLKGKDVTTDLTVGITKLIDRIYNAILAAGRYLITSKPW